ncbi:MAG: IclR family transcriptional regulator [Rhodospirillaceae bacterium]|nr:IclR family transcriptional regulator [Rhodospirillaceae bacterium]
MIKINKNPSENIGGVQSVEVGTRVLLAVKSGGGPMGLKSVASKADLPPANTRRYLVSLIRSGLVEQDAATGKYSLGPIALQIGLSAIMDLKLVRTAVPIMAELRDMVGETVVLTVWGEHGPTIVHWEESEEPFIVNARIGSVFPVLFTATGHVYLSWLPRQQTKELVKKEMGQRNKNDPIDIDAIIKTTKKNGVGRYIIEDMRSLSSLAAPIFDHEKQLVGVITTYGSTGKYDNSSTGPNAKAQLKAADEISSKLEYRET